MFLVFVKLHCVVCHCGVFLVSEDWTLFRIFNQHLRPFILRMIILIISSILRLRPISQFNILRIHISYSRCLNSISLFNSGRLNINLIRSCLHLYIHITSLRQQPRSHMWSSSPCLFIRMSSSWLLIGFPRMNQRFM